MSLPAASAETAASSPPSPGWQRVRRWAVPALGILVLAMLVMHAHKIDWAGAWKALQRYPWQVLGVVWLIATASHALYGCFDLIGRLHTKHRLSAPHTWAIAVASYGFNLNLGSLVGGVALRGRLYARAGLDEATVAQIVAVSLGTNWLGYAAVAGGLFASGAIESLGRLPIGVQALRGGGVALLALVLGYGVACFWLKGKTWAWRGRRLTFPAPQVAALQLSLGAANWLTMASAMYVLLGTEIPYATTLGVLLVASIVGVVTPIPAGLGVLEAAYLAMLSGSVPQGRLMGAVLAYRALYYFLPLAGALLLYLMLERVSGQARPAH